MTPELVAALIKMIETATSLLVKLDKAAEQALKKGE